MHSSKYEEKIERWYNLPGYLPNAKYWEIKTISAAERLEKIIGYEAYQAFIDANIPDDTTWKQCCELIEAKLAELKQ